MIEKNKEKCLGFYLFTILLLRNIEIVHEVKKRKRGDIKEGKKVEKTERERVRSVDKERGRRAQFHQRST